MAPAKAGSTNPYDGPLSTKKWNRVEEASDHYHRTKARGDARPTQTGPVKHDRVPTKNVTGGDVRRGEVLQFTDLAVDEVEREGIILEGDEYTTSTEFSGWGLTLSPIEQDGIDDCLVVGICVAYVTVNDAGHQFAGPVNGSKVLSSATSGPARIVYKPSGTGEKECVVLIGLDGPQVFVGKTTAAYSKGSTGTISRWAGATLADTGIDDSVINLFGDVPSADKYVVYVGYCGKFYAVAGECE